jgi:hypothetical protein
MFVVFSIYWKNICYKSFIKSIQILNRIYNVPIQNLYRAIFYIGFLTDQFACVSLKIIHLKSVFRGAVYCSPDIFI